MPVTPEAALDAHNCFLTQPIKRTAFQEPLLTDVQYMPNSAGHVMPGKLPIMQNYDLIRLQKLKI